MNAENQSIHIEELKLEVPQKSIFPGDDHLNSGNISTASIGSSISISSDGMQKRKITLNCGHRFYISDLLPIISAREDAIGNKTLFWFEDKDSHFPVCSKCNTPISTSKVSQLYGVPENELEDQYAKMKLHQNIYMAGKKMCSFCKKYDEASLMMSLNCGHQYHKSCLSIYIKHTIYRIIALAEVQHGITRNPACCQCGEDINNKEMLKALEKDYFEYVLLMEQAEKNLYLKLRTQCQLCFKNKFTHRKHKLHCGHYVHKPCLKLKIKAILSKDYKLVGRQLDVYPNLTCYFCRTDVIDFDDIKHVLGRIRGKHYWKKMMESDPNVAECSHKEDKFSEKDKFDMINSIDIDYLQHRGPFLVLPRCPYCEKKIQPENLSTILKEFPEEKLKIEQFLSGFKSMRQNFEKPCDFCRNSQSKNRIKVEQEGKAICNVCLVKRGEIV